MNEREPAPDRVIASRLIGSIVNHVVLSTKMIYEQLLDPVSFNAILEEANCINPNVTLRLGNDTLLLIVESDNVNRINAKLKLHDLRETTNISSSVFMSKLTRWIRRFEDLHDTYVTRGILSRPYLKEVTVEILDHIN